MHLGRPESGAQTGWLLLPRGSDSVGFKFLNVHAEKRHPCADARAGVRLRGLSGFCRRARIFPRGALIEARLCFLLESEGCDCQCGGATFTARVPVQGQGGRS